ncbi:hypothetical protein NDK47_23835 [Brevibacillus ruminantium]|uniref:Phage protein n=1 Tax=Brevibacillus ruminantium TaxID=2950604 RepID=A0ABY4WGG5_9BACL|nr:hypothetical protein [Brevibacillus ruminantium]USG65117.1 hypothetical protein NDK47_23835 [Brevibacillus ruminantium]
MKKYYFKYSLTKRIRGKITTESGNVAITADSLKKARQMAAWNTKPSINFVVDYKLELISEQEIAE